MNKPDAMEFYNGETGKLVARVETSFTLVSGSLINIRGETWRVSGNPVFALDNADSMREAQMRCNIDLIREPRLDP